MMKREEVARENPSEEVTLILNKPVTGITSKIHSFVSLMSHIKYFLDAEQRDKIFPWKNL